MHTPGPWEIIGATEIVKTGTDWACIAIACNPRQRIEDPVGRAERADISNPRFDEACANARLIAAAPEMYAALKAIRDWLLSTGIIPEKDTVYLEQFVKANNVAHAAIAKAEGKTA